MRPSSAIRSPLMPTCFVAISVVTSGASGSAWSVVAGFGGSAASGKVFASGSASRLDGAGTGRVGCATFVAAGGVAIAVDAGGAGGEGGRGAGAGGGCTDAAAFAGGGETIFAEADIVLAGPALVVVVAGAA